MKIRGLFLSAVATAALLAGCGSKTPSGQVVATVGKHEITMRQLRAEMSGVKITDPKQEKTVEIAALRNIVGRTILADAARARKIDKTPDFVLAHDRAGDAMLAEALQRQVAGAVPTTSIEDAQKFIDANPDMFAQHKIFDLDQLRMPRITNLDLAHQLQSLKTLEEIQATLTADKIAYQRGTSELDSDSLDPKLTAAILKLPPGEPFVLPTQNIVTINVLKETKVVPFVGPPAVRFAQTFVTRQRTQQAVQRELQMQFAQGLKQVKFSKEFAAAAVQKPTGGAATPAPQPGKIAPK
ncbi:MAG TPA: hypothetical protein VG248_05390 [Caulobacteraceae bacterium]|jgi:EpsD family peptidyl-prolyl cis-trans isomerase|nr:hypothetical protein [Caulobacteraceae bacterium]